MIPILLKMEMEYGSGGSRVFLHDGGVSAFPEEQEFLIGQIKWVVQELREEPVRRRDGSDHTVTIICLNEYY